MNLPVPIAYPQVGGYLAQFYSSWSNIKISAVRSLADICFLHVLFGILIVLFN